MQKVCIKIEEVDLVDLKFYIERLLMYNVKVKLMY